MFCSMNGTMLMPFKDLDIKKKNLSPDQNMYMPKTWFEGGGSCIPLFVCLVLIVAGELDQKN